MQVLFKSRGPQAHELRAAVQRRLRFAVHRLNALMTENHAEVVRFLGPRGGADKRCRVASQGDVAGTRVLASMVGEWPTQQPR